MPESRRRVLIVCPWSLRQPLFLARNPCDPWFIFLTVGISLEVGLAVLGVGLAILFVTLLGVRVLGSFERGLANRLLGTGLARPDVLKSADGVIGTVQAYLRASSTWRVLAVPAGAVLGLVALHLLNAVARVNASIAQALLGAETGDDGRQDERADSA